MSCRAQGARLGELLAFRFLLCMAVFAIGCDEEDPPSEPPDQQATTLYVDASAGSEGDGSRSRPFQTIGAALAVAEPGTTIHVASGAYPEQLTITTSLSLVGESTAAQVSGAGDPSIRISSSSTVEIRDLTIDGIAAESGVTLDLQSVTLTGATEPALTADAATITMNGGTVRDAGVGGLVISGGETELRSVTVERCAAFGISAVATESLLILGGTFRELTGVAIQLQDSSAEISGILVEDVTSHDPGTDDGHGISVWGGDLVVEESEIFRAATRGLVVRGGAIEVSDCEFAGSSLTAFAAMSDADGTPSTGSLRDSTFEGNGTDVFCSGSDLDIVSNYFNGSAHPILTDTSALRIDRNVFDDSNDSFISLLQPGVTMIRDNRGQGTEAQCVFITYATAGLLIENNTFQVCRSAGISVSDSVDVTIKGNAIRDIREDLTFGNIGDGISLIDSNVLVERNAISTVVGTGIGALRTEGVIASNDIEEAQIGGIQLTDCRSSEVVLRENHLEGVTGPGIIVLNSIALVDSNEAYSGVLSTDGFGDGIAIVDHSEARVVGNTCEDNARNGVVILSGVEVTIEDNHLRGNGQYGIRVYCESDGLEESTVTIGDNEIEGNGLGDSLGCD